MSNIQENRIIYLEHEVLKWKLAYKELQDDYVKLLQSYEKAINAHLKSEEITTAKLKIILDKLNG